MQPVVQALLFLELPRLVADALQIVDGCVSACRQ